ncbi:hypothetical protein [Thalassococcus sp. S3]|uniref:hypothetical protein n=1 Tax=Thalassococcus sp. S3 TaxID=2017482 RepID=UPI0010246284|nr:hypothetical protein [Thalassococcus sp. S3]QBF30294.1 hypothetical protein CFI11_03555 [Thalassococcus sp. S3]
MHVLVLFVLTSFLFATPAEAGAWMREKGKVFNAVSSTIRKDPGTGRYHYDSSVYIEWGAAPKFTLGFDSYENFSSSGHILIFGRVPLSAPDAQHKFAFQLGVGAYRWLQDWQPLYRTTLSYGTSFQNRFGDAWLSVDAAVETRRGASQPLYKLDATFGITHSPRIKSLISFESAYTRSAPVSWTIGPAMTISAGKLGHIFGGVQFRNSNTARIGLKIGLWREF